MFIDSHCHLDFSVFNKDRNEILAGCLQNGIKKILVPGVSPEQWQVLTELCATHTELLFAVGLHPWWIEKSDAPQTVIAPFLEHTKNKACVAVGECGLDANIDTPMALQRTVFDWHLQQAHELDLPVIVHSVKAHNEVISALNKYTGVRGVVHAFSGSYEIAQEYWRRGFYLGIGGTVTYKRATKTRDAVARIPLQALLLETDAPDMPLAGKQGQRNSPEYIPEVAQVLAELKNIDVAQVAKQTSKNFLDLFQCKL